MYERPITELYYLKIAKSVSDRSTCLSKRYGAVIVKKDIIVSTGYNGAPRGRINCCDIGKCMRQELNISRGYDYATSCRSVHAEMNALLAASYEQMSGATLYLYGYDCKRNCEVDNIDCCPICKRLIINAGIAKVIFYDVSRPFLHRDVEVSEWVRNDETLERLGGY